MVRALRPEARNRGDQQTKPQGDVTDSRPSRWNGDTYALVWDAS